MTFQKEKSTPEEILESHKEAEIFDELINQKTVESQTVNKADKGQINEVLQKDVLFASRHPDLRKMIRVIAKSDKKIYGKIRDKIQTTLGESKNSDLRKEATKENIKRIFSHSIKDYNQKLTKQSKDKENIPQILGVILLGSRMSEKKKPRETSELDFFLIVNDAFENYWKKRNNFIKFLKNSFENQEASLPLQYWGYIYASEIHKEAQNQVITLEPLIKKVDIYGLSGLILDKLDKSMEFIIENNKDASLRSDLNFITQEERKKYYYEDESQ